MDLTPYMSPFHKAMQIVLTMMKLHCLSQIYLRRITISFIVVQSYPDLPFPAIYRACFLTPEFQPLCKFVIIVPRFTVSLMCLQAIYLAFSLSPKFDGESRYDGTYIIALINFKLESLLSGTVA